MSSDTSAPQTVSRDELALKYLDRLPFAPYPVQEQALFAWFGSEEGVLVCAPTGMGKTLIAEAAAFEALHTGSTIYSGAPIGSARFLTHQLYGVDPPINQCPSPHD